jgi:hypothetical protein
MNDEAAATPATASRTLSRQLQDLLDGLDGKDTTLGSIVDAIGERGFGLLLAVLALPAALPLPAPGYATPFGILMLGLGFQMLRGQHRPTLPQRARRQKITHSSFAKTLRGAGLPLKAAELLVRPRLSALARNRALVGLIGVVIMVLSVIMIIPIPLTNTLPSFAIFLLACGLLEKDGLLLLGGLVAAPVAAAIGVLAIIFAWTHGLEALSGGLRGLWELVSGGS